jgi:hypothetical protein
VIRALQAQKAILDKVQKPVSRDKSWHFFNRYCFTILGLTLAMIGYAILLHSKAVTPGTRYMAIYFVSTGGFITQLIAVAWLNSNMGGHYKRGIAAAVQIGLGNAGGWLRATSTSPNC